MGSHLLTRGPVEVGISGRSGVYMWLESCCQEYAHHCWGTISRVEFEKMLMVPEAAQIINEIGVDVVGLVDFADFIFHEGLLGHPFEGPDPQC